MKLTAAQLENLRHVERFAEAKPRSNSGYWCRTHGLTEFVWRMTDGSEITRTELDRLPRFLPPERCLDRVIREQLTDAGRSLLESMSKEG